MQGGGVRVREVMSSPVVTVVPGMPLKEVAKVLVTRAISAVPVVDAGELVGILSEADLVPLELAPDPRAHLAPVPQASPAAPRLASQAMTRDVAGLPPRCPRRPPSPPPAGSSWSAGSSRSRSSGATGSSASWPGGTCWRCWPAATRRSPVTWRRCWRPHRAHQTPTGCPPPHPVDRRLATLLARSVPGVLEVRLDEE